MPEEDSGGICGPCELDVHSECHRHDGEPCSCTATEGCGANLRVFIGDAPMASTDEPEEDSMTCAYCGIKKRRRSDFPSSIYAQCWTCWFRQIQRALAGLDPRSTDDA